MTNTDTAATVRPGDMIDYRAETITVTAVTRNLGVALIAGRYTDGAPANLGITEDTVVTILHRA